MLQARSRRRTVGHWLVLIGCLLLPHRATAASAPEAPDDEARYFQTLGHYIVESRKVQNELSDAPIPFLDWGHVQPGFIAYVDKSSGKLLPLNDPHDVTDPQQVRAIPVAVPSGVRIAAQPASRGGSFAQTLFEP